MIQIKHADWPYILQYFSLYIILTLSGSYFLNDIASLTYLIFLSVFFLILTSFHIYRMQEKKTEYLQYRIQAMGELYKLITLKAPLPPMNGWAATPELAITVKKYIQRLKPKLVVEIGSGVTTIVSAYSMESIKSAGKIISLDHDPTFADETRKNLQQHQLSKFVEIRVAELQEVKIGGQSWKWYNTEQLQFDSLIDLVIIDGPPVKTQKFARYPALPFLYKNLAKKATIIIHDTNRYAESVIIKKWLKEFPAFKATKEFGEKGITVLHKR